MKETNIFPGCELDTMEQTKEHIPTILDVVPHESFDPDPDKLPNYDKLLSKIAERGFTIESICASAGFARSTFDRKLTGQSEFYLGEIWRIITVFNLSSEETHIIFFAELVA